MFRYDCSSRPHKWLFRGISLVRVKAWKKSSTPRHSLSASSKQYRVLDMLVSEVAVFLINGECQCPETPRGNFSSLACSSLHSPKTRPAFPRAAPTMSACHVRLNARVVRGPLTSFAPNWPCPIIPRLRSSEAWVLVLAT
jgi:hypothetical protein